MKTVKEKEIKLKIPEKHRKPEKSEVFYNPKMKMNRSLSVASAKIYFGKKNISILDPFSATGVRAIRYAKELKGEILASDVSQNAVDLTEKNAELNDVEIETERVKANVILNRAYFDLVDIDPFGSPAPFLQAASKSVKSKGMLGITATDATALCGVYPKVCLRNYGAVPLRTEYCHEIAMRILIGFAVKEAAVYEKAVEPLLVLNDRHYFRLQLKLRKGAKRANKQLDKLGFIYHCFNCGARKLEAGRFAEEKKCECGEKFEIGGPVWTGKLFDKKFCRKVLSVIEDEELEKQIKLMLEEVGQAPLFYDVHEVFRGSSIPKLERIVEKLKENGFKASRTHFSPVGIRTNAGIKDIKKIK
ncbi:MAG: tRNA (guanine(10)-N(2))-dimethyltransferase [Candidatus Undinarchaeales archaeon]